MRKFRFQVPSTLPKEAIVDATDSTSQQWLIWWSARYRYEEDDDVAYVDLIDKNRSFSADHFREIGKWKDNAYTEARWKPNVASVAYVIWEQAAEELPLCPEETEVAAFLTDWSERTYTDKFSSGPVTKRFGLSRATTLLHFISGGRYPIFDSRVRTAIAALLERPKLSDTVGSYMQSCLPLVDELIECCRAKDIRMLDEALFSYGRFISTATRPRQLNDSSETTPSSIEASYMDNTKVTLPTWGGRGQFQYEGSVKEGTLIFWKGCGNNPSFVKATEYNAMRSKFSGQDVSIGTSFTTPPNGSLGKWLTDEFDEYGMTSYIGPILIREGYAVRGSRSDRIRFNLN